MKYRVKYKWPHDSDDKYEYNVYCRNNDEPIKYIEYATINEAYGDPVYKVFHIQVIEVDK